MELIIDFPDNLYIEKMIEQEKIPCICQVGRIFEIIFQKPLTEAIGIVDSWDRDKFELCARAGVGGKYTHQNHAMITIKPISQKKYKIQHLSLFYEGFGWCPVIIDGNYGPPGNFWGSDEDDIY